MNNPRVAIIVDGPNLYHSLKYLGLKFNFWALFRNINYEGKITLLWSDEKTNLGKGAQITIKKYYYDALPIEGEELNSYLKAMGNLGFDLVAVKLKQYGHNGHNDIKKYKSRTEYKIYIDVIRLLDSNQFDILILFSGDSDFQFLLEECKNAGKRIIILSTFPNLAKELRDIADVILIENLRGSTLLIEPK